MPNTRSGTRKLNKPQKVVIVKDKRKKKTAKLAKQLGFVFPKQRRVNMRYCESFSIDSSGTTVNAVFYRANGINDPRQALGGDRPLGYDQWSEWYNHYTVVGSKIMVKLFPLTNTTNIVNACGVYLSDDVTIPTQFNSLVMQGRGKYKLVPTAQVSGGSYNFTYNFSAKKFFNISDIKDNTDRLGASFGSDPSEQAYFSIWCQPVDQLTDTGGYSGVVVIDYIVDLSEPKDIPDST